jgi:hypothetical protein
MTSITRTTLLTHPLQATPDKVEAYRVELPPGEIIRRFDNLSRTEPAIFIAFYLLDGDQPLIQPIH